MKNVVVPGKKTRGPCETCGRFVPATYGYGSFGLTEGTVVENVMRATCDECGTIVALAQQSAPVIKKARDERDARRRKAHSTVRLPRALLDFAAVKLSESGARPEEYELLLKAFAMSLAEASRSRRARVLSNLVSVKDAVLEQPCDAAVNLNLSQRMWDFLGQLQEETGTVALSELVRRILVVLEGDRKVGTELRKLVLVV